MRACSCACRRRRRLDPVLMFVTNSWTRDEREGSDWRDGA